jgi:hypothetical protein
MINKLTKPRPHPGASPHIASWDSPYLLIILIRTSKSRFGDMSFTELVSDLCALYARLWTARMALGT